MSARNNVFFRADKCIDLFCGLGGWTDGFLAEGYDVIGFDVERRPYSGQLVLQDVATLHGSQFADVTCIVASPPCQAYSFRAMPWTRARALPPPDNSLFEACFRIQREACEASDRYIPMVVENVVGAQKWVGPAKWHYGSFYLWGDVPALMPLEHLSKRPGHDWNRYRKNGDISPHWRLNGADTKEGRKGFSKRFTDTPMAWLSGNSEARKAASAQIAKIPFPLARYIAQIFKNWTNQPQHLGGVYRVTI